jgi:hypothetical protein
MTIATVLRLLLVAGYDDLPVNIIVLIELKNIDIPLCQAFVAFGFGNLLASVLDDAGAAFDRLRRKEALACNRGCADPEQRLHGILACVLAGGRARLCTCTSPRRRIVTQRPAKVKVARALLCACRADGRYGPLPNYATLIIGL